MHEVSNKIYVAKHLSKDFIGIQWATPRKHAVCPQLFLIFFLEHQKRKFYVN